MFPTLSCRRTVLAIGMLVLISMVNCQRELLDADNNPDPNFREFSTRTRITRPDFRRINLHIPGLSDSGTNDDDPNRPRLLTRIFGRRDKNDNNDRGQAPRTIPTSSNPDVDYI